MRKPCSVCGTPSDGPRCPTHAEKSKMAWTRPPGNSAIGRSGSRWQKIREAYFREVYSLCEICCPRDKDTDVVVQAEELDHRIPRDKGGNDDFSNLRPLCLWHHYKIHGPHRGDYDHSPGPQSRARPLVG